MPSLFCCSSMKGGQFCKSLGIQKVVPNYLEVVERLEEVDTDDEVDTELEVETLKC